MASVLDLRGARWGSLDLEWEAPFAVGVFSGSDSMGIAPSTGISRDEMKVAGALFGNPVGAVLEPGWGMLSTENLGDLPLREGVPLGVDAEGLGCMVSSPGRIFAGGEDLAAAEFEGRSG